MSIQAEEWRAVPGYEGQYEVSDKGRVKNVKKPSFLLKSYTDKWGHKYVTLKGKIIGVHRLVAWAFIGPQKPEAWVLHGPNGTSDNSLTNIYYGTPKQNAADRKRDCTNACGERNGRAKLKLAQVLTILQLLDLGMATSKIAKSFDVDRRTISLIKDGVNWKEAIKVHRNKNYAMSGRKNGDQTANDLRFIA